MYSPSACRQSRGRKPVALILDRSSTPLSGRGAASGLSAKYSAVLTRRMPPWGAIKGFGEFKNDQALTQEQIELIVDWIQNDGPRGNNRRALPMEPSFPAATPAAYTPVKTVSGATRLDRALVLDGLLPEKVASSQSIKIIAALPDGRVEPLIWLHQYDDRYKHPFMFRKAVRLPAGTVIQGVPADALVGLLAH